VIKRVNNHRNTDPKTIFNPVLFWDAGTVNLDRNAGYVISRVLNFGNWQDIEKLKALYPVSKLIETVKRNRGLLPPAGKYWAVRLNIPLREVVCLKKYYR
jgi:hypothetical protein